MAAPKEQKEKLFDLLRDFDTSVLVTRTAAGDLRGRPMAIAEISKGEGIWFATSSDNAMLDDIAHDSHVCLSMQSKQQFVSLSGLGAVHADQSKVDQLWRPTWQVWFPQGKDDPKIRLIQVLPTQGDYWDLGGKSRWQVLWEMGEAYCMNRQPIFDSQTHGHVDLV
ncbi:MAG: pyridoxamine 5'-phosphate oxidase family protein [Aureliella sp.]|jgi:general stress protein 26